MNTLPKNYKWILLFNCQLLNFRLLLPLTVFLNSSKQVTDLEVKVTPTPTTNGRKKNVYLIRFFLVNLDITIQKVIFDVFYQPKYG